MRFKIIETELKRTTKILKWILRVLAILLFISVIVWDYEKGNNYYAVVICILYICTFFLKLFRSFLIYDFNEVGAIIFYSNGITIEKNGDISQIAYVDMHSINIAYYGYDGESYPYSNGIESFNQKQGNKNFLQFTYQDNEQIIEFHVSNRTHSLSLFKILRYLESNRISFSFSNKFGDQEIYHKF